jgi:hypothetical protein
MSMWEQIDNINDYYKDQKTSRSVALRILNRHIKKKRDRKRGKKK